jgi:hypothetical protein
MNQSISNIVFAILLFSFSTFNLSSQQAKHFVVIGVDGMSPDGIKKANTPVMDKLMREGASTMYARGVLSTSSSQNWASMIMGAGPEQHGITSNGWERDEAPFPPVVAGREGIFPTIFCELRKQKPNAEIGIVYDWSGFGRLCEKSCVNYDKNPEGEVKTTEVAVAYIKEKKPNYLFIHLDHVDGAGHGKGHGSSEYYKAVEKADSLIGKIIGALNDAGIMKETVVLITSDHGGKGYGHGGESLEELEIPFILYGKNVKRGKEIIQPVYQYDNAATAAFALGITQPYAWIGRAVKSAFVGFDDPAGSVAVKRVQKPIIHPINYGDDPAGGLFIGKIPYCNITSEDKNVFVHFTTDGTIPTIASPIFKDSFKVEKSMVVMARAFSKDTNASETQYAYFRIVKAGTSPAVSYKYFEMDSTAEMQQLPDFKLLKPIREGKVYEYRTAEIPNRGKQFSVEFTSKLVISKAGKYRFYTISDDGSKLYVNGKDVVDNDGNHGNRERSGTVELKEGEHDLKVTYFNGAGGMWLDVYWSREKMPKQILSPDWLR